jgi:hypothetical protein
LRCRRASPDPSRRDDSVRPTLKPIREKNVDSASVSKKYETTEAIAKRQSEPMQITEGAIQRVGECHCGALKVITAGEPERVYLCHCKACQRRTGTSFHFGVTYRRGQVRLEGEYNIYERGADSGSRIRFYFCPTCGSNLRWESERNPTLSGVAGGALDNFDLSPTSAIFKESMHSWRRALRNIIAKAGRLPRAEGGAMSMDRDHPMSWLGKNAQLRASVADGLSVTDLSRRSIGRRAERCAGAIAETVQPSWRKALHGSARDASIGSVGFRSDRVLGAG